MRIKNIFICVLGVIFLCSCNITKRRYLDGYYVYKKSSGVQNKKEHQHLNKKSIAPAPPIEKICETKLPSENTEPVAPIKKACKKRFITKCTDITSTIEIIAPEIKQTLSAQKVDPENSLVEKPLSLFWIVIVLVLILYLAVIIFAADSLLPLGHVIGIIFAGLFLLWLLRVF